MCVSLSLKDSRKYVMFLLQIVSFRICSCPVSSVWHRVWSNRCDSSPLLQLSCCCLLWCQRMERILLLLLGPEKTAPEFLALLILLTKYNKQFPILIVHFVLFIMAVPFIQIGQCGNQVGSSFFNYMHQEALKASPAHQALLEQYFSEGKAKALLVDMEPKVVNRCLAKSGGWAYNPKLSLVREQGSGNNWAYGCYAHGPNVRQDIETLLRRVAEPEDYINMFVQVQSLAGGTGSGLGSYMMSVLEQKFPKVPKVVCCVMPHLSGEVILQAYNASLSLGSVHSLADGVFLIQNDAMNKVCTDRLNIKKPQLQNINKQIARCLASFFFPVIPHNSSTLISIEQNGLNYGRELVEEIFYDNRYKLAGLKCAPYCETNYQSFSSDSWQSIQNQLTNRAKQIKSRLYIARGIDHTNGPVAVRTITDRHAFGGFNRSGVMVENGMGCASNIGMILQRAYNMMGQNAYLYQYEKYGLKQQILQECLAVMEQINTNYTQLK